MNSEPVRGMVREIFASVQGEGKYLGRTQFFVRFSGCNLACPYCDTSFNPGRAMDTAAVMEEISSLKNSHGAPHAVSLTGGEPLFQPDFCRDLLAAIKDAGCTTYLETNATLAKAEALALADIVSADIKPPEDAGTDESVWDRHAEFLALARNTDLFVKLPVSAKTTTASLERAARTIAAVSENIPFFLQPVHCLDPEAAVRIRQKMRMFANMAGRSLNSVSVLPQVHKLFFVR